MSTHPALRRSSLDHPLDQPGVRWGIAGGTLFAAAAACAAVPLAGWAGVLTLLVVTLLWCRCLPVGYAGALGLAGWAFATGFAVNTAGQLTFSVADLGRLALYVGTAVLVAGAQ